MTQNVYFCLSKRNVEIERFNKRFLFSDFLLAYDMIEFPKSYALFGDDFEWRI